MAITFADHIARVNATTVALTLLLAVLGIAARWGLLESITASLAGMLCFNFFFLPPVWTWTISDPQNWVALVAFLATSVVASQLSARAKRRAAEATSRQHEMERLYALSRALMLVDPQLPAAKQIAGRVAEVFGLDRVLFYDRDTDQVHQAGSGAAGAPAERLREAAQSGAAHIGEDLAVLPVSAGGVILGSLALPVSTASETALRAIAQLAAVALERARGQEAAARAEAARLGEELKSAMLDALAHEFKTPLTSIKAAVTTVLSAEPPQREMLEIVDEETDRLTALVTQAIQMARLESGRIELRKTPQQVGELVQEALASLAAGLESRRVDVQLSPGLPPAPADPELVRILIRQLVDNAVKYSPPDAPIAIRAVRDGDAIVVTVADRGPGIPEPDRNRVFEKFFRGRDARGRIPGTGMGLAIAREIVKAHHGRIWVETRPGQGSEFSFSLPIANP